MAPDWRFLVMHSLLLPRGLFADGTWPSLEAAEVRKLHSWVMYAYRLAAQSSYDDGYTDQQAIHFLGATAFPQPCTYDELVPDAPHPGVASHPVVVPSLCRRQC